MVYDLVYSQEAVTQLAKLDKNIRERIISALERIRIRPYPFVNKLVGLPYFRLRVGDYRVILNIIENKFMIFVIDVGHRKKIYKNFA